MLISFVPFFFSRNDGKKNQRKGRFQKGRFPTKKEEKLSKEETNDTMPPEGKL